MSETVGHMISDDTVYKNKKKHFFCLTKIYHEHKNGNFTSNVDEIMFIVYHEYINVHSHVCILSLVGCQLKYETPYSDYSVISANYLPPAECSRILGDT